MAETNSPTVGQSKPKHAGGRPRKLTQRQRKEVYDAFEAFIVSTPDSRITKFVSYDDTALQYNVTDDNLYDWPEFSVLRKKAIKKQEDYLLEFGGSGKYNPTIAIFRLKQPQHGYTDRQDRDITSGGEKLMGVGLSADQAEQLIRARTNRSDI